MSLFLHYLSLPYMIAGITFTLAVTALGLVGGLILGLVLAAMQLSRFWLLARFDELENTAVVMQLSAAFGHL